MSFRVISRSFSGAKAPRAGFMSWFDNLKPSKRAEFRRLKEKVNQVDDKNAAAEQVLDKGLPAKQMATIGLPPQLTKEEVKERLGIFQVKSWVNPHKKITTEEQLDAVLIESWNELKNSQDKDLSSFSAVELSDLNERFAFFKKVQTKSGHLLPDLVLTQGENVELIREYFVNNVLKKLNYNENLPGAINLDQASFKDLPNVVVHDANAKDLKKKYKKLLRESNEYYKNQNEQALSQ